MPGYRKNRQKRHVLILFSVAADFLINFSVFWFGLAIVSPVFPGIDAVLKLSALTADILVGILSLFVGYVLRRRVV